MSGVALANGPETSSAHPHEHAPIPSAAPPRRPVIADRARPVVKATPRIVRRKPSDHESATAAKPTELMSSAKSAPGAQTPPRPVRKRPSAPRAQTPAAAPGAQVGIPAGEQPPRPPTVAGYRWALDGQGWKLRKAEVGADGKRRERYVARLGKLELAALKRKYRTDAALVAALTEWAREREAEKGIG